jgi:hypothetical protein
MTIAIEPWGGIAVSWPSTRLELLVDGRDAWFRWNGRLVGRAVVGVA